MVLGFNPTLVRLRQPFEEVYVGDYYMFQSHAGSIEAQSPSVAYMAATCVSIPRWFD